MLKNKGETKLLALEGLAYAQFFGLLVFILCAAVLITVPCWCIGRFVVARRRKKLIAAGGIPPRPPSRLRKTVQGVVSFVMIALWCVIVYFIVSRYAYPLFSSNPLPYLENYAVTYPSKYSVTESNVYTDVHIQPVKPNDYSVSELASTCVSAVEYYAKKYGNKTRLTISACPGKYKPYGFYEQKGLEYPWKQSRTLYGIGEYCSIAYCFFNPKENKQIEYLKVAVNADNIQPEINQLWVENEDNYQLESQAEAEQSLKKLISEKLDISLARTVPKKFNLKEVPGFLIPNATPQGPEGVAPINLEK